MYNRHKIAGFALFAITMALCYFTKLSYNDFAPTAITIVSISVAVYIAAMSALLGSPYADKLKSVPDKKIIGKTQLGVLTAYLRTAGSCGVLTIFISSLFLLPKTIPLPLQFQKIISSLSYGVFTINLLFLWLIFQFFATALINSAKPSK